MGGHDELGCITAACGMYQEILAQAGEWSGELEHWLSPEDELRFEMPRLLAHLSPQARAMLADHLDHVCEMVAHVHRMEAIYETANRSSA